MARRRYVVVLEVITDDSKLNDPPGSWDWEAICDVDGIDETVHVIHASETKECPQ